MTVGKEPLRELVLPAHPLCAKPRVHLPAPNFIHLTPGRRTPAAIYILGNGDSERLQDLPQGTQPG